MNPASNSFRQALAPVLVIEDEPSVLAFISSALERNGYRVSKVRAELVIQGLTNREAAARMFLSPHTIDFHLRRMFRKLGVRSRVELTRALLQSGQ